MKKREEETQTIKQKRVTSAATENEFISNITLRIFGCFNDLPTLVFTISRQVHGTTGALHHKTVVAKPGPNLGWARRVESGFDSALCCRPPATEGEADSPTRGKIERPVAFGHVSAIPFSLTITIVN